MVFTKSIPTTVLLFCLLINSAAQTIPTSPGSTAQNAPADNNVRVALDDYFRKAAGLGFSGAVLVARGGQIIIRKGYGWADVKRRIPIRPDTIFDIGSGVKAFTATAIMQLEEQGKLNTSDPITKYLKDVPSDKTGITIHQLLTHTSGLDFDYYYDEASPEDREIMKDRERYIKGVLSHPLAHKPGEGAWIYSNTGFSLLAVIIENVSGESYERYVGDHLFKPAGMTQTGYFIPLNLRLVARGYNDGDTDYGYPWETQWAGKRPLWDLLGNGGMLTTLDDLYKWLVAIKGDKIVSQKSKDKMFQIYDPKNEQGYGWNAQTGAKPYVWRGGDAVPQAWNVEFRWYRDDDLIAIVLTNRRIRAGSIRRYAMPHLVNIALFGKSPALPAFAELKLAKLRRFEGTYKLESGALFHVKASTAVTGDARTEPVLLISGEGQRAIDLLFSAAQLPGLEKLSLELNNKTLAYIEGLRKNDIAALKSILPADSSVEDAVKSWNDFVKKYGALEKSEMLGTSPLNQSGVQTFVRLKFKKTAGVYKVTWRDQKLWEQNEDRLQPKISLFLRKSFVTFPLNLAFLPQSETNFATYDLFKGRTINITFGSEERLVVHTKDGDVVAQKVKTEKRIK